MVILEATVASSLARCLYTFPVDKDLEEAARRDNMVDARKAVEQPGLKLSA